MNFKQLCDTLTDKIKASYEEGVTLDQAEKLAAEFLHAQLLVSGELKKQDLDARMKKTGVKAVRAAIYTQAKSDTTLKLTEAGVSALIDVHEVVQSEQNGLDKAEVERDELDRIFSIFREGHIYFRGIAKGKFE